MYMKIQEQAVQFLHTLLQYCDFHSLVLGLRKTSRRKGSSCSFSSFCGGQTLSSKDQVCISVYSHTLTGQRGKKLSILTSKCTEARLNIFKETGNREKDYEHTCMSNLPLL